MITGNEVDYSSEFINVCSESTAFNQSVLYNSQFKIIIFMCTGIGVLPECTSVYYVHI